MRAKKMVQRGKAGKIYSPVELAAAMRDFQRLLLDDISCEKSHMPLGQVSRRAAAFTLCSLHNKAAMTQRDLTIGWALALRLTGPNRRDTLEPARNRRPVHTAGARAGTGTLAGIAPAATITEQLAWSTGSPASPHFTGPIPLNAQLWRPGASCLRRVQFFQFQFFSFFPNRSQVHSRETEHLPC